MNHLKAWLPVFTPILLFCSTFAGGQVEQKAVLIHNERSKVVDSMFSDNEIKCLARNLYHEARGESETGMQAVGLVTINRTQTNGIYPESICRVVHDGCQFSWVCQKQKGKFEKEQWEKALRIAQSFTRECKKDITLGSTLYHTKQVHPRWDKSKLIYVKTIGRHMFFRERGVIVV